LKSPQGVTVTLAANNGGTGHNFAKTVFDDAAVIGVDRGTASYTGRFRVPVADLATLSAFNGANPNGTWTLNVTDTAKNRIMGTLTGWKLYLNTAASPPPQLAV